MIVRVQDPIVRLVLGAPKDEGDPVVDYADRSSMGVWDGDRLVKIPPKSPENLSYLEPLIPEWIKEALLEGTTLFMEQEDWVALDYRLQEYMDVIKH